MPYKKEYHKFACPMCGKEYEVLTPAYLRKIKDPVYGAYCTSCRARIQMQSMTDEQREELHRKAVESSKKKYESLSNAEKEDLKRRRTEGTKRMWANMSEEERQAKSQKRSKDRRAQTSSWTDEERQRIGNKISEGKLEAFNSMTREERREFFDRVSKGHKDAWDRKSPEDKEKVIELLRQNAKEQQLRWENMTDEERRQKSEVFSINRKEAWDELPENEKEEIRKKLRKRNVDTWNSMNDEERAAAMKRMRDGFDDWISNPDNRAKLSDGAKAKWANKSKDEQDDIIRKMCDGSKEYWNKLSEDELKAISDNMSAWSKDLWANRTEEERNRIHEARTNGVKRRWQDLSNEDREKKIARLRKIADDYNKSMTDKEKEEWGRTSSRNLIKYIQSLSEEEYRARQEKLQKGHSEWLDNMSYEDKAEFYRRIFRATSNRNKFNKRFEKVFKDSVLNIYFYYIPELPCRNNNVAHCWDYGIFDQNDELVMVVDLDGAYFHADVCDYDGLRSHEESDEKRWLSVPDEVMCHIIQELKFDKSFDRMCKLLKLDYAAYVDRIYEECRNMPFPYPHYTDEELIKSWNGLLRMDCNDKYHTDISMGSKAGDRLILNFHPSIYRANIVGNVSPNEAWYMDDTLKELIRNHAIYQSHLNRNKILQGFNVSDVGRRVTVFSAGRAKLIINKYLSEYDTVFDPFSGFSGRMLGTLSLGKRYIGQDISETHIDESKAIAGFLCEHCGPNIAIELRVEDVLQSHGEYQCLFTSPPTIDEEFIDVPASSLTCDEWIDVCMERFKCDRYVFVVDKTEKYENNVVEEIVNKTINRNNEILIVINGA